LVLQSACSGRKARAVRKIEQKRELAGAIEPVTLARFAAMASGSDTPMPTI